MKKFYSICPQKNFENVICIKKTAYQRFSTMSINFAFNRKTNVFFFKKFLYFHYIIFAQSYKKVLERNWELVTRLKTQTFQFFIPVIKGSNPSVRQKEKKAKYY